MSDAIRNACSRFAKWRMGALLDYETGHSPRPWLSGNDVCSIAGIAPAQQAELTQALRQQELLVLNRTDSPDRSRVWTITLTAAPPEKYDEMLALAGQVKRHLLAGPDSDPQKTKALAVVDDLARRLIDGLADAYSTNTLRELVIEDTYRESPWHTAADDEFVRRYCNERS